MINSKIKFFSPFHLNYKFNIFILFMLIYYSYLYFYNGELTHHFFMFFIMKMADWVNILKEAHDKNDYSNWLSFKKTNFFKRIIQTQYIYYLTSLVYISLSIFEIFNTDDKFNMVGETIIISIILWASSLYVYKIKSIK